MIFWIVLAIFLYGIGLRFFQLGGHSLWYDELVTASCAAQNSLSDFFTFFVSHEQNPPGFHFLVWLLTRVHILTNSEFSIRLISAVAGCLSLILIYRLTKKLWGLAAFNAG